MEDYADRIPKINIEDIVIGVISEIYGQPKNEIELDANLRKDYNFDDVELIDMLDLIELRTGTVIELDNDHLNDSRLTTVRSTITLVENEYNKARNEILQKAAV